MDDSLVDFSDGVCCVGVGSDGERVLVNTEVSDLFGELRILVLWCIGLLCLEGMKDVTSGGSESELSSGAYVFQTSISNERNR